MLSCLWLCSLSITVMPDKPGNTLTWTCLVNTTTYSWRKSQNVSMESHATSWEYIYIKTKLFLSFLAQMMKLKTCTVKTPQQ